jgi:hypothetical protein
VSSQKMKRQKYHSNISNGILSSSNEIEMIIFFNGEMEKILFPQIRIDR